MAHEIAHVAARHAMENQAKGMLAQIGLTAGSIFLGGLGGLAILNGAQFATLLGFMKFRRDAEAEADQLGVQRSEEHTSELQSRQYLVCRLLLEKQKGIRTAQLYHHIH